MTHHQIPVPLERMLSFEDYGSPALDPVLICHGGPGSRIMQPLQVQAMQRAGFRPIGIDRPGYGGTSPWPGRSIGDWTRDGLAVAEYLNLESFYVAGISTGASYALALASVAREQIPGVVISCGMSDQSWAAEVEDARMDLADEYWNAENRAAAIAAAIRQFGRHGEAQAEQGPDGREIFSPPDRAVLLEGTRQAADPDNTPFLQGVEGYADDRIADGPREGWQSFDVAKIRCPVILVHGEQDWIVPIAQARHTAELLDNSELRTYHQHGHLSVGQEIVSALVDVRTRAGKEEA